MSSLSPTPGISQKGDCIKDGQKRGQVWLGECEHGRGAGGGGSC